ncbi:protein Wnt-16 [Trematomus bernacchii]|uniref:protein Wnt-16 n=1 Tax=Trematomus bernacchii TaxID=40690 RepID=UPI00146C692C|nr:protein Wnt-16 [Trematomus bernacchii]
METRSCGVRNTWTLTLLLASVSPPGCTASWVSLGVSSLGSPERPSCSAPPLSPRQRDLCRKQPLLMPSVQEGARLAVSECQSQFRHERWNCSVRKEPPVFGHEMTSGSKETAFLQAVLAAGLVHAVTRACSQGNMTECGCDARLRGGGAPQGAEGWHWGGCSDHIQYGIWFSRRFIDGTVRNTTSVRGGFTQSSAYMHNSEAGRQAIVRTMSTHCRCHGVSGSCAVKTCWKTVAPFERVGVYLKERYECSVQVSDRSKKKSRRKEQRRPPVDAQQLVFINKSPNYCLEDVRRGVAGTRGRRCNRTSSGSDSCVLLCCGRGYNTHLVRLVQRCECKFVWCCYVHCHRCESMNDMHTCK